MKRNVHVQARVALAAIALLFAVAAPASGLYPFAPENVPGPSLDLKVARGSAEDALRAESAALAEIDRLSSILSTYDAASEASLWLKTSNAPTRVSPELFAILSLFDQWRARTDGALDA